MTYHYHKNDLPAEITLSDMIAVDTETLGLIPVRDPLCLVQLSSGDGKAHIVHLDRTTYHAPNLKKLLADTRKTKIFHYARFDIGIIKKYLGVDCTPIYCTRTASKLVRTYTDKHGLREICKELLNVDLNKQVQASDWGADQLSDEQLQYAAGDVLYLHDIKARFDSMLAREGRTDLAAACFAFLPVRAQLDLQGWAHMDIFEH
ncbi:MAG: ribonuclease D [Alphaproteobacteria bacterium]|nr:ribonuclease D [Alphaproteobacteria bacterium]